MTGQDLAFATQATIAREHGERVLEALVHIDTFMTRTARLVARGRDWYDADVDEVPRLACEALIIKVGDAATRIPVALREQHPEIPWTLMSDMRNHLTHVYDVTDYEIVWDTLESDFPDVHLQVRAILGHPADT
ncbi:HepT-like ribonuclease domain-containing protein [Phytoactinopolyspora halotolerans]|uniref:DUF86 domain-containing protein n=1 Tax=Phytoactinopolyspora halotolerans TaxID=1981512 RepID=A0A6L9SAU9_9ACTN|nr:HepT-like ribonuclease domain-containing protein [Phytoactinopolyspora halotolerans]NEE01702.1 DUF86 domain-containing protein [Phytoactinopolyspora halotolerans]